VEAMNSRSIIFLLLLISRLGHTQSTENYPNQFVTWFGQANYLIVNILEKHITKPILQDSLKKYSHNYEVLSHYRADQSLIKQIALTLLARNTYSTDGAIASCYFIPDASIDLYPLKGAVNTIMISLTCRKLFVPDGQDKKKLSGTFYTLSDAGFLALQVILGDGYAKLSDFDRYLRDSSKQQTNSDVNNIEKQLLVTEELIRQNDYSTLKKFKDTNILSVVDSLS